MLRVGLHGRQGRNSRHGGGCRGQACAHARAALALDVYFGHVLSPAVS
jgi:hypothetical protein